MLQLFAVTLLNLKNLPQRLGSSFVVIIGIGGVVAVLLAVMALAAGFRQAIGSSASVDRALVLNRGAEVEGGSSIPRTSVSMIMDAPGVVRNAANRPIASAETLIIAPVARKSDGLDAYVTLRGIGPEGLELRSEIKIVAGRTFAPAIHELIVGKAAASRFAGLEIGKRVLLRGGEWTIVGIFESGGSSHESGLLADAETVLAAYQRKTFNSVTVKLTDAASFARFKDALSINPALDVITERETDYVASASKPLTQTLDLLTYAIGGIMAIGALFAALNTMYSAVNTRGVEIATLRALGFGSTTIVVSVLIEAMLLVLIGALLGVAIVYMGFNGHAISTIGNSQGRSQLIYQLTVTLESVGIAIALALLLGLVGGLFPAIQATRTPIPVGLRKR